MKPYYDKVHTDEERHLIDWHSGFAGGLGLALRGYGDSIEIEREHPLSKEPIKIDFLVIKRNKAIEIDNAIGRDFRKYNILEYKNPSDELSIDVLWKCIGYAGLYKGLSDNVDEVSASELTVSILRYSKPIKLFKELKNTGFDVINDEPGIYKVLKVVSLPLQVVVIRELEDNELLSLKVMSDRAKEEDVRLFLNSTRYYVNPGDRRDADAVLQVSSSANRELFERIKKEDAMCQALKEILSEEIAEERAQSRAEGREEGREEGRQEVILESIKNVMASFGVSVEKAMDSLNVPKDKRSTYISML